MEKGGQVVPGARRGRERIAIALLTEKSGGLA